MLICRRFRLLSGFYFRRDDFWGAVEDFGFVRAVVFFAPPALAFSALGVTGGGCGAVAAWTVWRSSPNFLSTSTLARLTVFCVPLMASVSKPQARLMLCA